MAALLHRLIASAFSLEVALVGVLGGVLGALAGSLPVALAFAAVAIVAAIPVVRIWFAPDVLAELGWSLNSLPEQGPGPNMLRRPWGLRLGGVPQARVQRDVAFSTPPGRTRPLLCDLWQPPAGVLPSGLAFIYFHGSSWVVFDKDIGTRALFGRLAAQGHVVMYVAYRLFPETDIEGMVGDVRRSVAWMKAHGEPLGVKPDRIVIGGGSAGAHLALLAAYTEGNAKLTPPDMFTGTGVERRQIDTSVRGVLAWYGPVDSQACYFHFKNDVLAAKFPIRPDWNAPTPSLLVRLLGPTAHRVGFRKMSGSDRLDWILEGTIHIIVPRASAESLRDKMRQAGAQMALLLLPRIDHAFDLFAPRWSPSARKSIWHAEHFLDLMARGAPVGSRGLRRRMQPVSA